MLHLSFVVACECVGIHVFAFVSEKKDKETTKMLVQS